MQILSLTKNKTRRVIHSGFHHAIAQTTGATNWLEIRNKFVGEPIEDSHLVELFP
jgi:hypothetical protein